MPSKKVKNLAAEKHSAAKNIRFLWGTVILWLKKLQHFPANGHSKAKRPSAAFLYGPKL
jgi:hypothetical protein